MPPRAKPQAIGALMAAAVVGLLMRQSWAAGISETCTLPGAIFTQESFLGAYCTNDRTEIHGYEWAWINLDWCVRNDQGELKFSNDGRFSRSCIECDFDGMSLNGAFSCRCYDAAGRLHDKTTVHLDEQLWNRNGSLGCYDHIGNKTRAGPQCKGCTQ